ncbi:hypothetical protein B0H67DRAFT_451834, partial [Lasiosphaeris hirsuta]
TNTDAVINPLSHPPDILKQFIPAGHPADQPLPSAVHPYFPHRPIPDPDDAAAGGQSAFSSPPPSEATSPPASVWGGTEAGGDGDDEGGWESEVREAAAAAAFAEKQSRAYRKHVGCLATALQRFLAAGDVAAARRVFGLLARARVYGKSVDLRFDRYWEYGTEILMRAGEGWGPVDEDEDEEDVRLERIAANLKQVKTYYTALIRQHPWNSRHHLEHYGSLDFYPSLFSCEMEGVHTEHARGLKRLEREHEAASWNGSDHDMDFDHQHDRDPLDLDYPMEGRGSPLAGVDDSQSEMRLQREKDGLRLHTLERMKELTKRMDDIMLPPPFNKDSELLRLRGMAALYMGDLSVPIAPQSQEEQIEGEQARANLRAKAKGLFLKIKEIGGDFEEQWLLDMLSSDDEGD